MSHFTVKSVSLHGAPNTKCVSFHSGLPILSPFKNVFHFTVPGEPSILLAGLTHLKHSGSMAVFGILRNSFLTATCHSCPLSGLVACKLASKHVCRLSWKAVSRPWRMLLVWLGEWLEGCNAGCQACLMACQFFSRPVGQLSGLPDGQTSGSPVGWTAWSPAARRDYGVSVLPDGSKRFRAATRKSALADVLPAFRLAGRMP